MIKFVCIATFFNYLNMTNYLNLLKMLFCNRENNFCQIFLLQKVSPTENEQNRVQRGHLQVAGMEIIVLLEWPQHSTRHLPVHSAAAEGVMVVGALV